MSDDLLNILSHSNKDIDNQKLMDYLSGKLTGEEKHRFEEELIDSEFMSDAVEGLEKFDKKAEIEEYARELNRNLKKKLAKNKPYRQRRKIGNLPWSMYAILLILLLAIVAFLILRKTLI